jgi:hypothetical protein
VTTSCDEHQIAYLEGARPSEVHVRTCPNCQAVVADLDEIRDAVSQPAMWAEPDSSLESRVVAAVQRADMDQVADQGAARVVPIESRRSLRDRIRFTPVLVGAVAAVLLLGAVRGGGLVKGLDRGPGSDAQVALASTPLAPKAHGVADLRNGANGVEIKFHLSGLPRAPAGFYYQAWVKGPKGLVPIGTFHTGEGDVTLWSGVPLDQYHTITVTLEDEGGDPASSGKRVLIGELKAG